MLRCDRSVPEIRILPDYGRLGNLRPGCGRKSLEVRFSPTD
jgi:hypothetical protein